jgi:hypothetical protein
MLYDERGDKVFRFWRALSNEDDSVSSIWVYVFYDALSFIVEIENLKLITP